MWYVQVDDSPFEVLKDLHGTTVNHQYTAQERNILQSYNSEVCTTCTYSLGGAEIIIRALVKIDHINQNRIT